MHNSPQHQRERAYYSGRCLQASLLFFFCSTMPTTVQLVLANHNGPTSPYEWSSTLPDSLKDHIDGDTYSRTIQSFNSAYNIHTMRRTYRTQGLIGFVLVALGQMFSFTDSPPIFLLTLSILCSFGGAVLLLASCIYKCTMMKRMRMLLRNAIQRENEYYRELCNQRASPLNIVWSLSSRTVLVHDGDEAHEEEEPMIACEVVDQSEMISTTEIEIVETSAIVPDSTTSTSVEHAYGNGPEGATAEVTIEVDEEYAVSAPPSLLVPHDQYIRQIQIMHGER